MGQRVDAERATADRAATLVLCRCEGADLIDGARLAQLEEGLARLGLIPVVVPDLCGLVGRHDPRLASLKGRPLTIIGCYPRALRSLLESAGIAVNSSSLRLLNLRERPADEILAELGTCEGDSGQLWSRDDPWTPWFPVIDSQRCSSCQQCASFCLFGVFETTPEGHVMVARPAHCKTNCPACARVCPEGAIIFPKLDEAPINGAEVSDEEALKARIRIDVDRILGPDIYKTLAARRQKASRLRLRREALARATAERARCSCSLVQINAAEQEGP
jgi:NAD-dependent dihydropyrimidine dehydrogenase PreA subunit